MKKESTCGFRYSGFIGFAELKSFSNFDQHIFLNNRPVHCPPILKSITNSLTLFQQSIPLLRGNNTFVFFFIYCSFLEYYFIEIDGRVDLKFHRIQELLQDINNYVSQILNESSLVDQTPDRSENNKFCHDNNDIDDNSKSIPKQKSSETLSDWSDWDYNLNETIHRSEPPIPYRKFDFLPQKLNDVLKCGKSKLIQSNLINNPCTISNEMALKFQLGKGNQNCHLKNCNPVLRFNPLMKIEEFKLKKSSLQQIEVNEIKNI